MKIPFQQLSTQLSKTLAPVYFVSGDEPFQLDEASRMIREAAAQQGFSERHVYHVERGFDWQQLLALGSAMSLFAEKKCVELRLPSAKPGTEGAKVLQSYVAQPPDDCVLLISAGKLEAAQLKAKWLKAVEAAGVLVQVWPIELSRLPQWIQQRLSQRGMQAKPEVLQVLAERIEGNLLAADQELEKLYLLHGAVELSMDQVQAAVTDSARYDVFSFADATLLGDAQRVTRLLFGLRAEGIEPVLVLWALAREIRALVQMNQALRAGAQLAQVMQAQRVWDKRKPLVQKALKRMTGQDYSSW